MALSYPHMRMAQGFMPGKVRDLACQRFGRLLAVEIDERGKTEGDNHARWLCKCDCGETITVRSTKLTEGRVVSCGCWRSDPAVRQAARLKTSARRRKQIARMGQAAWQATRVH